MRVLKRSDAKQFIVTPKRWVIERSFAWFNNFRRLAKDYEISTKSAVAFIKLASIRLLIKKLLKPRT